MTKVRLLHRGGAVTAARALHPGHRRPPEALSWTEAWGLVQDLRRRLDRAALVALYQLARGLPVTMPSRVPDAELFAAIEPAVRSGHILFTKGWRAEPAHAVGARPERDEPPSPEQPVVARTYFHQPSAEPALTPSRLREQQPRKLNLEVQFLEAGSGRPLRDLAFVVRKPDGSRSRSRTAADGRLKVSDLDPGTCFLTSLIDGATMATSFAVGGGGARSAGGGEAVATPEAEPSPISPAFLVVGEPHRVATGDTPDSIAAAAGVPWSTLARFNFETTDPDELQKLFHERLGCTRTKPDGSGYVFDDGDDPGIIFVPHPWTGSFAVGAVHEVPVSPMRAIYLSLENEDGVALPGAAYSVTFADRSRRQGRLGRAGIARLDGVPEGPFSVAYPDRVDLLARSLAASTRHAFDEQATGPLFYLLGQEQQVVDKAVAVYEEYFDDLTGEGFAADIDQVVTDPEARPPLVFLCHLAGIEIEGTDGVVVHHG